MIGNLKVAMLVAVSTFALAAPAASGQDLFTAAKGTTTVLTGSSVETSMSVYTGPELSMDCGSMTFAGTFKSGAKEVTVLPTYDSAAEESSPKCDLGDTSFPLELNGCGFNLTGDTSQKDGGKTDAVASIVCPGKAEIVTPGSLCAIRIPAQTPTAGGVSYTNELKGKIRVKETLTGLKYKTEGMLCAFIGFSSEADTLDFVGAFVLEGYEDLGGPYNGDEFEEGGQVAVEVS